MLADGAPQAENERICREKLMHIAGHASTLTMLAEGGLVHLCGGSLGHRGNLIALVIFIAGLQSLSQCNNFYPLEKSQTTNYAPKPQKCVLPLGTMLMGKFVIVIYKNLV